MIDLHAKFDPAATPTLPGFPAPAGSHETPASHAGSRSHTAPPSSVPRDTAAARVVLSLFPGVGLLDAAFEAEGFIIVRGPDLIWGGDIRRFHPPPGLFWGVIGGPPCQDFSSARRAAPTGYGLEMLAEYRRVVTEGWPEWWLAENVDAVPDIRIDGYSWQRTDVEQGWYCDVRRLRHVQFGSRSGAVIEIPRGTIGPNCEPAALASDNRSLDDLKRLQGVPPEWDLPGFTVDAKKRAIGNGVPFVMGRVLARAVHAAYAGGVTEIIRAQSLPIRRCLCGCGRRVTASASYAGSTCRKRAQRRRDRAPAPIATIRGT